MSPRGAFVLNWSLTWAQFGDIQKNPPITKLFSAAYQNVLFHFRMAITDKVNGNDSGKFGVIVTYEGGPLEVLRDAYLYTDVIKNGHKRGVSAIKPCDVVRGRAYHIPNMDVKDADSYKEKHGLATGHAAEHRLYISMPLWFMTYKMEKPVFVPQPDWLAEMYSNLESSSSSGNDSDVRLISSDGRKFYCHKIILTRRSVILALLIRNPRNEKQKSGEYEFPDLNGEAMGAVLKYVYTGDGDVVDSLPTESVVQVGHFCRKFGFNDLQYGCLAQLWRRVVENPEDAIEILRYVDDLLFHYAVDEAKYLKDRALDVLVEKFEELLSPSLIEFSSSTKNGVDEKQNERLRQEFVLHMSRRIDVDHEGHD